MFYSNSPTLMQQGGSARYGEGGIMPHSFIRQFAPLRLRHLPSASGGVSADRHSYFFMSITPDAGSPFSMRVFI